MAQMSTTWVGVAFGVNATVAVGVGQNIVCFVNMARPTETMLCGVTGVRLGAAVHASVGYSIAIMTGVKSIKDVSGVKSKGVDFAADFGAKYGSVIKTSGWGLKAMKALHKASDAASLAAWAKTEPAKQFVNWLTGDLSLPDDKASFAMIGTPAGLGVGAGVWYEWQQAVALDGPTVWTKFKPKWRVTKHMGKLWLQMDKIPAQDGTEFIVNFREDVWGRDNELEVTEPFLKDQPSRIISGVVRNQRLHELKMNKNLGVNAPKTGGLNLTDRTLVGRRTAKDPEPLKANTKFNLGLAINLNAKTVWETTKPVTMTTDKSGDFETCVTMGKWMD